MYISVCSMITLCESLSVNSNINENIVAISWTSVLKMADELGAI